MRIFLFLLFFTQHSHAQSNKVEIKDRVILKTNLLNLFALGPSLSVDKAFNNKSGIEISYMKGHINNFFRTEHYAFEGVLVRVKKYFLPLSYNQVSPYVGIYSGTLSRIIQRNKYVGLFGIGSYEAKDFKGQSIRTGGTAGFSFTTKNRINFDVQSSFGYGIYYKQLDKSNTLRHSSGYFDMQLWACIGYCF